MRRGGGGLDPPGAGRRWEAEGRPERVRAGGGGRRGGTQEGRPQRKGNFALGGGGGGAGCGSGAAFREEGARRRKGSAEGRQGASQPAARMDGGGPSAAG